MTVITTTNDSLVGLNATVMLGAVVDAALNRILFDSDSGLIRYFAGGNAGLSANFATNPTAYNNLRNKLISWFGGYLGCVDSVPAPLNASQLGLASTHTVLKISNRDAVVFNAKVMSGIVDYLVSVGVNVQDAGVQALAGSIAADLQSLVGTYAIPNTNLCDKYASILGLAFFQNASIFGNVNISADYQNNLNNNGTAVAFWRYFVDWLVIKNGIAGNATAGAALIKYFSGPRTNGRNFLDFGTLYYQLVNKLVGWFGQATGCSDATFVPFGRAAGGLGSDGVRINLAASHQPLNISAGDNTIFNFAVVSQASLGLGPLGLTAGEATAVINLLNGVTNDVVYQGPAPTAAAPKAAGNAPSAPVAATAPTAPGTPKSSAAGVAASLVTVFAAFAALLL